mgnify:FL=1
MENTKKIIAINGSCRRTGTTTQLTEAALEGAASSKQAHSQGIIETAGDQRVNSLIHDN